MIFKWKPSNSSFSKWGDVSVDPIIKVKEWVTFFLKSTEREIVEGKLNKINDLYKSLDFSMEKEIV